ncbi:MAG TPA: hypothetical protein PLI71_09725 [Clostridia bacterium]|nr:hypothetical protein [Clostridia bacterium]
MDKIYLKPGNTANFFFVLSANLQFELEAEYRGMEEEDGIKFIVLETQKQIKLFRIEFLVAITVEKATENPQE